MIRVHDRQRDGQTEKVTDRGGATPSNQKYLNYWKVESYKWNMCKKHEPHTWSKLSLTLAANLYGKDCQNEKITEKIQEGRIRILTI